MSDGKISVSEELAVINEKLNQTVKQLNEIYKVIIGTDGNPGLKTKVSLNENSIKRLWYLYGSLLLLIGGVIVKIIL